MSLLGQFPAVLILGTRRVGKTTLAKLAFPEAHYCDLQTPELRQLFVNEPTFQVERRSDRILILDEAQAVPPLFAALRGIIDRRRKSHGQFLLLGSADPKLVRQSSESLASRVGILDLNPLTALEASQLLEDVVAVTGARSKKEALQIALEQVLRARRREKLCRLIGNYDGFTLSLKKLEKMRNDA